MGFCVFCHSREDLQACDFPVWDFARSTYAHLKIGDKVRRITAREGQLAATVIALEATVGTKSVTMESLWNPRVHPNYMAHTFAFSWGIVTFRLRKANGVEIERQVKGSSAVQVLRDRNCEVLACPLHRCERGPGATYCADHWRVQSLEVA